MLWRRIWVGIAALTLGACSQPQRTEDQEPKRTVAAADTAPAAPARLVDGVLAERSGIQGAIRVEQRDGRRLLIIGNTIHAAIPWSAAGADPSARDPLVELLHLVRPGAKTALIIGLGSGRTATELAQAGVAVTAIELEKAVIELARAYFGYRGEAVAAEGLAYLRANSTAYDLVLMDAFSNSWVAVSAASSRTSTCSPPTRRSAGATTPAWRSGRCWGTAHGQPTAPPQPGSPAR